ncbi:MAG TPA: hypothetical protein PKK00_05250 [Bacteroidales bacterium]|nr:hypothetical protein [Bacteroidales bacterium]HPS18443.1 hypothetical protein [Bacteroidales bacterium]
MKLIKYLLIYCFCLLCFINVFAQDNIKNNDNDKLIHRFFTGGTIGLQFGNYTYVNIAPIVGYRLNDYISCGVGPNYIYYHYKDPYSTTIFKTNLYGANFFSRVYFLKDIIPSIHDIYLHGEIEGLNVESAFFDIGNEHNNEERYGVISIFGGAGVRQAIGEKTFVTLTVLYNFNETIDSPYYGNPLVYRVGIEIGL